MPVLTVNPTAVSTTKWSPNSGTAIGAITDGSDATYLDHSPSGGLASSKAVGTFDLSALPAGAAVAAARLLARARQDGTAAPWYVEGDVTASFRASADVIDEYSSEWAAVADPVADSMSVSLRPASSVYRRRLYEMALEVEYNERPVATLDALDPVTDTSRPTLTWDYSDPEDDPQESFRPRLYDSEYNLVYDPGWIISSATSHQLPTLDNGASYVATVQVRQQWSGPGTHESAVDTITFTMDLDVPAAPDVLAVVYHDDALVTLEITDPTVSPEPEAVWFTVEYRDDPDDDWTTLRGAGEIPVDTPVLVADYEAPFGVERTYRVRGHTDASGQTVASDATIVTATLASEGRWVTDPRDPDGLHVKVKTREHGRQWQGREVVHLPAGMSTAVVESEPPVFGQSLSVWSLDPDEHETLVSMLKSTRPLLYRDRRTTMFFRWHGDRTSAQFGPDFTGADALSGSMVEVARPT